MDVLMSINKKEISKRKKEIKKSLKTIKEEKQGLTIEIRPIILYFD